MTTTTEHLAKHIAASDPSSAEDQQSNLERITRMREDLPGGRRGELATVLDLAATLTEYLLRLGGLGPRDVLDIVAGLVGEVEERSQPAPEVKVDDEIELAATTSVGNLQLMGSAQGGTSSKLLGEILIRLGTITSQQRDEARMIQQATGVRLGEALVSTGATDWDGVTKGLTIQKQITNSK